MDTNKIKVCGFRTGAVAAGLKKDGALDLALIVSEQEATAAGVFTRNKVQAAPVILTKERIGNGKAFAIIANAGNANACTGEKGIENARATTELIAKELGIEPDGVLVASTGVIGAPLQMDRIEEAIPGLARSLSPDKIIMAAESIMTTDTFPKVCGFEGMANGKPYSIVGVAKGAGMIMPNMATMLCFIMSDIEIEKNLLQKTVLDAGNKTFNRISVDGDTSTNDMILMLANGMAGNGTMGEEDIAAFQKGLNFVMDELSRMIVKDGEGATKVVKVMVKGAATPEDAETAARTIANSSLVKTAFYGQDPNWGRIIAALGRADIQMEETRVDIRIDDIPIVEGGLGKGVDNENAAAEKMKEETFDLIVNLNQGEHEDYITTCDLTHDYISINADYRT